MLKTRRVEYTLEYFRGRGEPKTIRDVADLSFINEMRFQSTRFIWVSNILGINCAVFSYLGAFRHLRWYMSIPLTFTAYFFTRNLVLKRAIDKIYYPIEPIFKSIRHSHGEKADSVDKIQGEATKKEKTLDSERDDLSTQDKAKLQKILEEKAQLEAIDDAVHETRKQMAESKD